jgi:hypothetical protein
MGVGGGGGQEAERVQEWKLSAADGFEIKNGKKHRKGRDKDPRHRPAGSKPKRPIPAPSAGNRAFQKSRWPPKCIPPHTARFDRRRPWRTTHVPPRVLKSSPGASAASSAPRIFSSNFLPLMLTVCIISRQQRINYSFIHVFSDVSTFYTVGSTKPQPQLRMQMGGPRKGKGH